MSAVHPGYGSASSPLTWPASRGNPYRLVCVIDFVRHGVLVLWIGTHAEYDRLNGNDGAGLKAL
jgi:hypothetical protein